jgi:tRNA pseudouridine65 synthase
LPATTGYSRLATVELPDAVDRYPSSRYALVELLPGTGRQHQLRRHLKHIAHPIIGDANWGKGVHNRFFQQRFGCHRLLLACTRMELRHPQDGRPLSIEAPLEESFASVVAALGWDGVPGSPDLNRRREETGRGRARRRKSCRRESARPRPRANRSGH